MGLRINGLARRLVSGISSAQTGRLLIQILSREDFDPGLQCAMPEQVFSPASLDFYDGAPAAAGGFSVAVNKFSVGMRRNIIYTEGCCG